MAHQYRQGGKLSAINIYLYFFLLLGFTQAFAQKEANIWYFGGNAGLDFSSGAPTTLSNSALYTGEGCSTISDPAGNLLFYTNGVVVYNSNHQIMAGGGDLQGGTSSSQAAIIVKKPGSATSYYIFTSQAFDNYLPLGLNFYEVDMSLNAGLGAVTKKNNLPLNQNPNPPLATPVAEKLTAVYHADGEQIWVISHKANNSQDFIAYLVSSTGVNTTPVTSTVGTVHDRYFIPAGLLEESNLAGCIKASPDGSKLAVALYRNASMFVTTPLIIEGVELFDFNASTGVVSNAKTVNTLKSYGVEFSPNSDVLYTSSTASGNPNQIYQYDVTLGTQAAIQASQVLLTTQNQPILTLQLAPDGKMYAAKGGNSALHVINNPNILGTGCNFQASGLALSNSCFNGLPNFLTSYFAEDILFDGLCAGSPTTFTVSPYTELQSASWNFGDPDSGTSNTSTQIEPSHTYSQPGTYTVTVDFVSEEGNTLQITGTVTIVPAPTATMPANLTACTGAATATYNLTAQTPVILGTQPATDFTVTYYTTQADATAGTNAITGDLATYVSGNATIYVRVQNNVSSCFATTSFQLVLSPLPTISQVAPITACDTGAADGFTTFNLTSQETALLAGQTGVTVTYYTSQADAEAGSNTITTPATFTNTVNPQTIYVALTNAAGCKDFTLFVLNVTPAPAVPAVPNLTACDLSTQDGFTVFNLTQQNALLLAGQTGATVAYYTNQADALAGTNPIATPDTFTNTANPNQTIYAVVTYASGCINYTTFTLNVIGAPVAPTVGNLSVCDSGVADEFATFNLSQQDVALLNGQTGVTVTYYTSLADAEAGTNAITTPAAFTNTVNPQTIYAVLTNAAGCNDHSEFTLNVLALPAVVAVPALEVCDDNTDGISIFNLTQQQTALLNGQTGVTVDYFTTQADAEANINAIVSPASYSNLSATQTVYVRLGNGTCFTTTSFVIRVLAVPEITATLTVESCEAYDLTSVETQLDGSLTYTYYTTQADAAAGTNEIAGPSAYTITESEPTVYLRAENASGCFDVAPVSLTDGDCMIQRGISPNGDDKNNSFDLSGFDVRKLEIFNRYGKEVYTKPNYRNEWIGQTDKGDELPTGTYFYVIEFNNAKSKTGWIYINRQN
ncbi:T9SS type B sorting domain-containing protein [Flavobacterium zepuense]|uniref:T9SS type B sorting domain-containing protein n=1 Tax=Flavobacterium zepuense TaxID=2593302 RepID=A0A552V2U9_9FLAO|nr:gliding motility-associated C-terminal domain-containing protein [Flavobacterium zepuense]TRW24810.1 T9SS type B sorting domain-containing protein [Flavobacterium zepuense]